MAYKAISLKEKYSLFTKQWAPKVIAEMNDYQFKLVKLEGDFVWHDHPETDEAFLVIEGTLRIPRIASSELLPMRDVASRKMLPGDRMRRWITAWPQEAIRRLRSASA